MLSKKQVILDLRKLLPGLKEMYSVTRVGIFGSFNSETQHDQSDIDLLVEFSEPIGWRFFRLQLFLEDYFGRKVDLITKKGLKADLKERILESVEYIE